MLTNIGAAKLANATALGAQVEITQMAVGDGNGALPTPNPAQTALTNEQRRAQLNMLTIDPVNTNQIIAEQVIPEDVGGWWIREIGLFDKDGDMIAVANCAETYKPKLQEGSGRVQVIRVILIVSSTEAVTLKIDPSVVLATRQYVDDAIEVHEQADNPHPQYLQTDNALQEITDAGTAAVSKTLKNLSLTETHFGALLGCKKITSSGTYKASPGTKMVIVELLGGGGAGGGSAASASGKQAFGGGGGAGAYLKTMLTEGFDNVFVTIGAGGTGVTGAEGGNGGDTKFGDNVVAGGGKGGSPMMTQGGGLGGGEGKGGVAYGANIIASTGHAGWSGMAFDVTYAVSGRGAESVLFPGGQASGTQTVNNGYDALEYGCGGGGACSRSTATAFKGGTGSQGIAIIWEYA
nr:phage tail protein [Enterobacter oligotrophicus]